VHTIEGTYVESRIHQVFEQESSGKAYSLRPKKENDLITEEMKKFATKECEKGLLYFGYSNFESEEKEFYIKDPSEDQKQLFKKY